MLGDKYSKDHDNRFGVLTKILDIGAPIPWHIHARDEDALKYWNSKGKEEAYYFLDTPNRGPLPYSLIGVHPYVTREDVLPLIERWNDDKVLDLSPAYRLNMGEGFHVLAGIPHAPGTALTMEVQEESDVYNILQAYCNGKLLSKDILLKGLPNEETVLDLIYWEKARDPQFYRKYHTIPEKIKADINRGGGVEHWIFNPNRTSLFSGKELRIPPGGAFESQENGAYAALIFMGEGKFGKLRANARDHSRDELFVTWEPAVRPHRIVNTGKFDLMVYKLFGPDVNKAPCMYETMFK